MSILLLLVGCSIPEAAPTLVAPSTTATSTFLSSAATPAPRPSSTIASTDESPAKGLSDEEVATLSSLEQVDGYPLYTMRYYGAYRAEVSATEVVEGPGNSSVPRLNDMGRAPAPACSLFAALSDADNRLYGRNFDWQFSPAVLLFTDPPAGYASASMVDIAYLVGQAGVHGLAERSLAERRALLRAPFMPFDGMNEHGLAVGMAAVPESKMPYDPDKETADSLRVIREMLDHARDVDEAVALLENYNISWQGGPPLHYLVADASGHAALVEFYQGQMVVIPNETPWHLATNFLRTAAGETAEGVCWRYDKIQQRLAETGGRITVQDALDLLQQVSQAVTQWSVVYDLSGGGISVAMGRQYEEVHTLHLNLTGD
jgi:hypothetical protein